MRERESKYRDTAYLKIHPNYVHILCISIELGAEETALPAPEQDQAFVVGHTGTILHNFTKYIF